MTIKKANLIKTSVLCILVYEIIEKPVIQIFNIFFHPQIITFVVLLKLN
jgi:hypothetical protein